MGVIIIINDFNTKNFSSFDEKAFWKAIEEKDLLCLKVYTVSAMRNDPTFERGETAEVISVLEDKFRRYSSRRSGLNMKNVLSVISGIEAILPN